MTNHINQIFHKKGSDDIAPKLESKLGEIKHNKHGTKMQIVEYINRGNITIQFLDEHKYTIKTTYQNFKIGQVKNPYDRTCRGAGYLGVGKYMAKENNKTTKIYAVWSKILCRCYDLEYQAKYNPAYKGCIVCEEWLNYQNFAKWYEENYYEIPNDRSEVEKDILFLHCKIYSPETCMIVPQSINMLFKRHTIEGRDLPIGIYKKDSGLYEVYFTYKGFTNRHTGIKTLDEACEVYKTCKEKHLKMIADDYEHCLPPKLIDALRNYDVKCDI